MEIYTIGGFNEVGKNMTVVKLKDDAIIFDAGFYLPAIVELQAEETDKKISEKKLREVGALPDDMILDRLGIRNKVRAILLGHAHLDHIGAVPYLGYRYNAPVVGTPFTISVLKKIIEDEKIVFTNPLKTVNPNSTFMIKGLKRSYKAEFINITHSTIQTSIIALHTPEGIVLYANDFKLDNSPIVGLPPNYDALKRIAREGVKAIIIDSLYSGVDGKTPSEKVARTLLEEVMLTTNNKKSAMVIASFSSHIARIKSIVDFSKKLDRKVYLVGRSLKKYVTSSIDSKSCPFEKDVKIASYKKQIDSILRKVNKERTNAVLVVTGHQGEPGSVLDRLTKGKLPFQFRPDDHVIFASKTIPTPINILNKEQILRKLKKNRVRIFDNVHVSGHAGREDIKDLLTLINPQNIIPAHGTTEQLFPMVELAKEIGYRTGKECHMMNDGHKIVL
jgi:ribonuclease J